MAVNLTGRSILADPGDAAEFLTNILQASTEYSIIGKNLNGDILVWNEGAHRLYGYAPDEVVGKANSSILHTPEDIAAGKPGEVMEIALREGKWEGNFHRVRKSGDRFPARVVITPWRDTSGKPVGFLLISKDISAEVRVSEQLQSTHLSRTRDLETAKQELESFTYAVSHDLRTPLHHLQGFSDLLEERYGTALNPEASELVRRIHRTSCTLADLVQTLLDLSRLSRQEIQFEPVPLDAVLKDALEDARAAAGPRSIDWRIHPLPVVNASRAMLKQVFAHLFSNAVKFTGRTAGAAIEVGETTVQGESVIYVRDNGAGFDPQHALRVFGVFQRLHPQSEYPGIGAGLAIAQRIISRHGGRIWAESAPGRGATFYFTVGSLASR